MRPAFASDTPAHVTAAACDVCSTWLGSGVVRDLSHLKRVYQLLVASLDKLKPKASPLYNESALTLEKLSILKAWAEVYIVCMKEEEEDGVNRSKTVDDDDDFGDFATTAVASKKDGGGLATLVQEELPSLSKHWLAALKDHALLSLPPEFKPQLPREGGAFYSDNTAEEARPHYKSTWPPILVAAAVWLSYGQGFDDVSSGDADKSDTDVEGAANLGLGPANAASAKLPEDINGDRFFLLFGICMEALSHARSADMTREETAACLKALHALLDHPWARREALAKESVLLVELCNVLHRTILTRDHPASHLLVVDVLKLVLTASKERVEAERRKRHKELELPVNSSSGHPELDLIGEGGDEGELDPKSSVVFASLEVCLCILVRYYPELSERAASLHSVAAMQAKSKRRGGTAMTAEQEKLVASTLTMLSSLPSLCSPNGAVTALPSVLWLLTGVVRSEAKLNGSRSEVVSAALNGVKTVALSKYASDERSEPKWSALMQSALLRILDVAKTAVDANEEDEDEWGQAGLSSSSSGPDEMTVLTAVAVFVLHCPAEVVCADDVLYPSINTFVAALRSNNPQLRLRAVQTMQAVFRREDKLVSVPYIHGLAPRVFELLSEETNISSDQDLAFVLECVRAVEVLMSLLNESDKKLQILSFLLPALVNQLLEEEEFKNMSNSARGKLHESSLNTLTRLGQTMPNEFKDILAQRPELKSAMSSALLASRARAKQKQEELEAAKAEQEGRRTQEHKPTIQLKMDFSNFGK